MLLARCFAEMAFLAALNGEIGLAQRLPLLRGGP